MPAWLGGPEFLIIVLVIVVVFGWKKLPDAARSLGRSMRIFKAEVEEMKDKPSAASRETVVGETRREDVRVDVPRDGDRYTTGSTPAGETPVTERVVPTEDTTYRPPMA